MWEDEVFMENGWKGTHKQVQNIDKTRATAALFFCVSHFEQLGLSFEKKNWQAGERF